MTPEQLQDFRRRIDTAAMAAEFAAIDRELQHRADRDSADVQTLVRQLERRSGHLVMRAMFRAMQQGSATQLQQEIAQRSGSGYVFSFSHAMDVPAFAQIIEQIEHDDRVEAGRVGSPIFERHKQMLTGAADTEALTAAWRGVLDDLTLSHDERGRLATVFEGRQARLSAAQMTEIEAELGTEALANHARQMGSVLPEAGPVDGGVHDDERDDDLDDELPHEAQAMARDAGPADMGRILDNPATALGHPIAQDRLRRAVNTVAAGFAAQRGVDHDVAVAQGLKSRILTQVINAEALARLEAEVPGISAAFTQVAEHIATIEVNARHQGR